MVLLRSLVVCLFLAMFLTGCQRQTVSPTNQNTNGATTVTMPAGNKKPAYK